MKARPVNARGRPWWRLCLLLVLALASTLFLFLWYRFLRKEQGSEDYISMLRSPDPDEPALAVLALGGYDSRCSWHIRRGVALMGLEDPHPRVRLVAIWALGDVYACSGPYASRQELRSVIRRLRMVHQTDPDEVCRYIAGSVAADLEREKGLKDVSDSASSSLPHEGGGHGPGER